MTETKTLTLTNDQFDQLDRVIKTRRLAHRLREAFDTVRIGPGAAHLWGLTDNDLKTLWAFSLRLGNAPLSATIRKALHPNVFHTGDEVSWSVGSDTHCGHVVKAAGQTQLFVVEAETRLLNGPNSGEPDALTFSPGGFVGHTSGRQRWEVKPGSGEPVKFTQRKTGRFIMAGASYTGAPTLRHGATPHHDYNF